MNTLVWGMVKLLWHYDFRRNDIATENEGGHIITFLYCHTLLYAILKTDLDTTFKYFIQTKKKDDASISV